jgi:putative nucleotidyltransferase with HDIG domain
MDEAAVLEQIPEIADIESDALQEKVAAAWVEAIEESEYDRIDEVPGLPMVDVDNLTHTRGVTRLARDMVRSVNEDPNVALDEDHVLAGAICHDLGKAFEYTELDTGERIKATWETSRPTIRHPIYSASIALSHDFPLEVVHIVAAHSREGDHLVRSPEAHIVTAADHKWWRVYIPEVTGEPMEKVYG